MIVILDRKNRKTYDRILDWDVHFCIQKNIQFLLLLMCFISSFNPVDCFK